MLGYSVDEWLSTPNFWLSIVHSDVKERVAREAGASFASLSNCTTEFRWVARDGHIVGVKSNFADFVLEICLTSLDIDPRFASAYRELKEGPHICLTVSDRPPGPQDDLVTVTFKIMTEWSDQSFVLAGKIAASETKKLDTEPPAAYCSLFEQLPSVEPDAQNKQTRLPGCDPHNVG